MKILNLFGKKDAGSELTGGVPYRIQTEWKPYKLYANQKSSASLFVTVKNQTNEVLLTSVVMELPKNIAFESTGVSNQREVRVGEMAPNEEKEVRFDVYSTLTSDPGDYTMGLTAIAHYRDYGHIINAVKKRVALTVV